MPRGQYPRKQVSTKTVNGRTYTRVSRVTPVPLQQALKDSLALEEKPYTTTGAQTLPMTDAIRVEMLKGENEYLNGVNKKQAAQILNYKSIIKGLLNCLMEEEN